MTFPAAFGSASQVKGAGDAIQPQLHISAMARIPGVNVTVALLIAASVLIYAPLIDWGLPYATSDHRVLTAGVDELLPLQALAEMHNTFIESKESRNYGYPWWHYFVLACAQAPYVAYLLASGQISEFSLVYPFGMKDPVGTLRNLTIVGRLLSVLMGAGVVVLAYYFARTLWDHATGVLAACITMLSYPHVYYSRVGNADVALVFWSAAGLLVFARILVNGITARRMVWLGIFAGVAMAAKDQAVLVFLPLGIALLVPQFTRTKSRNLWMPSSCGLLSSTIIYAIATGMLVDPKRHLLHIYYLFAQPERLSYMWIYRPGHPQTWQGIAGMIQDSVAAAVAMISWPVLVFSVAGIVLSFVAARRYLVLLLPIPAIFLILTLPTGIVGYRYYYPLTFILDAFAAAAIVFIARSHSRFAGIAACVLVLGWRGLIAADLSYAQAHETRQMAGEWFLNNAQRSETVEFFGVEQYMPPLPEHILSRRIAGRENWKGETGHGSAVLQYLTDEGPRFIFITPDHTSHPGMERSGDCPPEVYEALLDGSAGYRLAAHFETPTLLPRPLVRPRLDYPAVSPPVRIFERLPLAVQ